VLGFLGGDKLLLNMVDMLSLSSGHLRWVICTLGLLILGRPFWTVFWLVHTQVKDKD
jgi:hypothetical protein